MRVIAGSRRSIRLTTVKGDKVRPTTDRIKETLFNILQPDLPGASFLDLFSGSGAIGIEALSRGAKKAYFIDNSPKSYACIQENLVFTKLADKSIILKQDAVSALTSIYEKEVDIIFMDPPYDNGLEENVLAVLQNMKYVAEDTLIIAEASLRTDMEYAEKYGFEIIKVKKYKTNKHIFLKRK